MQFHIICNGQGTNKYEDKPTNQSTTERTNGGIFVTYFANYCTNLDAHSSIISSDEHHPAWSHGLHPIHGTSFAATERLRLGTCEPLAALLLVWLEPTCHHWRTQHTTAETKFAYLISKFHKASRWSLFFLLPVHFFFLLGTLFYYHWQCNFVAFYCPPGSRN